MQLVAVQVRPAWLLGALAAGCAGWNHWVSRRHRMMHAARLRVQRSFQPPAAISFIRRLEGDDSEEIQELQQPLLGDAAAGAAADQQGSLISRARKVRTAK